MKITKYQAIGEELTIETAAVQAAYALDSSASIAESQRDAAGMLAVGEAWLKLSDFLAALKDNAQKNQTDKKEVKMGFQPAVVEPDEEDDDNEIEEEDNAGSDDDGDSSDDGTDEGEDCSGLHREHGKLRIPAS